MNMDALSSRFLAAFNVVEDWMRHELDSDDGRTSGRFCDIWKGAIQQYTVTHENSEGLHGFVI